MLVSGIEGALSGNNESSSLLISTAPALWYKAQFQAISLLGGPAHSLWFQVLTAEPSALGPADSLQGPWPVYMVPRKQLISNPQIS